MSELLSPCSLTDRLTGTRKGQDRPLLATLHRWLSPPGGIMALPWYCRELVLDGYPQGAST